METQPRVINEPHRVQSMIKKNRFCSPLSLPHLPPNQTQRNTTQQTPRNCRTRETQQLPHPQYNRVQVSCPKTVQSEHRQARPKKKLQKTNESQNPTDATKTTKQHQGAAKRTMATTMNAKSLTCAYVCSLVRTFMPTPHTPHPPTYTGRPLECEKRTPPLR